jgi:HEPN domain-containing protein
MYKEWLKAANDDLILLKDIVNNSQITNLIAFHSQQAVEKTLKAYIEAKGNEVPKIHKIQTLVDRIDLDLSEYEEVIQLLDELYIDSRYPGDMGLLPYGKPTINDAREFYSFALKNFQKVCKILNIDCESFEKSND